MSELFLDIETTGLSPRTNHITMIGLYGPDRGYIPLVAGRDMDANSLLDAIRGVEVIYTFNGARFDLPFIRERVGVDLKTMQGLRHIDLMYVCRKAGLTGGQKKIETILDIPRLDTEMSGREAAKLGKKWLKKGDLQALSRLVFYNEEDCKNLWRIKLVVGSGEEEKEGC